MSELCPSNCKGNTVLSRLKASATTGAVVKEVTGCTYSSSSNAMGHPTDSVHSIVNVNTNDGERRLDRSELSEVAWIERERQLAASEQQTRVDGCGGEVELQAQNGSIAGTVIKMCGAEADAMMKSAGE